MATRSMKAIREDQAAAQIEYNALAGEAEREWRPVSDRIKALRIELSEAITEGAVDLPEGVIGPAEFGGNRPIGLRHIHFSQGKKLWSHTYEIGVGKTLRVLVQSPGVENAQDIDDEGTRAAAVKAWNRKVAELVGE